jgi:hypothetical protein
MKPRLIKHLLPLLKISGCGKTVKSLLYIYISSDDLSHGESKGKEMVTQAEAIFCKAAGTGNQP